MDTGYLVNIYYPLPNIWVFMSSIDEFLNIDTPENVVFGYEVVGIGSRFIAALIDTSAIVALQLVVNLVGLYIATNMFSNGGGWITAVLGLLSFAMLWGYYIFFEMLWNGQSPGKRWVGLRVIRADGTPLTLTESIIRNLVRIVDFLPLFYGVGLVAMFLDKKSRRLGDMAASTLVVLDQQQVTLESLKVEPQSALMFPNRPPTQSDAQVDEWPLELLLETDVLLAENFLQRQDDLSNRSTLALQIVNRLLARMGLPDTKVPVYDAVYVLARIVKLRRTQEKGDE